MRILMMATIIFISMAMAAMAQNDDQLEGNQGLGPGMTRKQVASFSVVAPEDARVSTDGKQTYVEGTNDYVARKFKDLEARLEKMEKAQQEMINKINNIEKNIDKNAAQAR